MSSTPIITSPEYIMGRLMRLREQLADYDVRTEINALILRTPEEYFLICKHRADELEKMKGAVQISGHPKTTN